MTRKLLEAFFRHKLLLLLPILLIPGIVTPIALLSVTPSYDAAIAIWVDHTPYLDYKDGSSPWLSPAQVQANRLSELLHTRSFQGDVAKRTSLAPLVGSPVGDTRIDDLFNRSVVIGRLGEHVLTILVQGPSAQLSYDLSNAILNAYQEKTATDLVDQSSAAVAFYQTRVDDTQQQLTKATQDVRRYLATLAANSDGAASFDPTTAAIANLANPLGPGNPLMADPKLSALQASLVSAQKDFDDARKAVDSAQFGASAALQGGELGFQVLDPARMPTTATRPLKKIVVYPIAALVVALAFSAVILVALVAGDRSARAESDLDPPLRVLGVVPALRVKRVSKQLRPVATRRAIGAAAGTALPAPAGAE